MDKYFQLKKILVCLDLSEMDEPLLKFTSYIARMMDSDRIYFVHVAKNLDMPDEIRKKYPDLFAPVDETLEKEIEFSVKQYFQAPENCSLEIEVREGNPSDMVLKIADQKDVDLIVLGKKNEFAGKGILPGRLAKSAHRSVLLVPEILPREMDRILVPVDFSKHSLLALQQAIKIKETSEIPVEVSCLNIFNIPFGWHSTGKSKEEFTEIMKGHAIKDYQKFLKKLDPQYQNIPCHFVPNNDSNIADQIYRQGVSLQADLIILGSKGTTAAASVLLGSTSEELADREKNIPLLVAKNKNENIGFLEALLNI